MKKRCQVGISLLLTAVALFARADISGRVVRVLDGDTVEVLQESGERTRVRLAGIDAPEKSQPFGQRSRQMLSARIAQQPVLVTGEERDRYGRLLGTIWLGNEDMNAGQIRAGMAWAYRYRGKAVTPSYSIVERRAREQREGLWADPAPVEPWRWRQNGKAGE